MRQTMRTLENSIFDVFEKMFFIYLEPCMAASTDIVPDLKATIGFGAAGEGEINIYFSRPFLSLMAQNMLSIEAGEIADEMREDCAREAANMVCGNFLALLDPGKRYDLTIPECGPGSEPGEKERLDYAAEMMPWAMTVTLSGDVLARDGAV